ETNARHHVDAYLARVHDAGTDLDIVRPRPRGARAGDGIRDRVRAPLVRVRSCAGDAGRRHLGRAARRAGHVATASSLPDGHGAGGLPGVDRVAAAWGRGRYRPVSVAAWGYGMW